MFAHSAKYPGSSPHVRGALGLDAGEVQSRGIIPACAGSTPAYAARILPAWDHPRMCGEHMSRASVSELPMGSSPHVRGALNLCR